MTNEYVAAYRLFAKLAGITPDEEMCIFQAEAYPGGSIMIKPGKPEKEASDLRKIVREEIRNVLSEVTG